MAVVWEEAKESKEGIVKISHLGSFEKEKKTCLMKRKVERGKSRKEKSQKPVKKKVKKERKPYRKEFLK